MQKKLILLAVVLFVNAVVCRPHTDDNSDTSSTSSESHEQQQRNSWPQNQNTFSNGQNSQERSWGRSGSNVQEAALLANTIERLPSSGKASSNVIYVKNNRNINNNGESQYDTNTNADVQRILPRANWAPTNAYPVYKSNESDNRNYLESQWNQRSQLHQIDNQNTRNWSSQRRSDQGQNHEQESEERRERQQERQWQAEAERREAAEEYKALHQDH